MHSFKPLVSLGQLLPGLSAACSWPGVSWLAIVLAAWCPCRQTLANPVSFRNDVMPVLSKAGCNQGACHGNQNGKNGFKLSLRGEDPEFDLRTLTRDLFGRRTDKLRPAESLVLRKATASVPHEGGKRFGTGSLD